MFQSLWKVDRNQVCTAGEGTCFYHLDAGRKGNACNLTLLECTSLHFYGGIAIDITECGLYHPCHVIGRAVAVNRGRNNDVASQFLVLTGYHCMVILYEVADTIYIKECLCLRRECAETEQKRK